MLEDEINHEIPNIHLFYRQARQMVYGILFNLHHAHYLAKSNSSQKGIFLDIQLRKYINEYLIFKGSLIIFLQDSIELSNSSSFFKLNIDFKNFTTLKIINF